MGVFIIISNQDRPWGAQSENKERGRSAGVGSGHVYGEGEGARGGTATERVSKGLALRGEM